MTVLIKQMMDELEVGYQPLIQSIVESYPDWKPAGGINASLNIEQAKHIYNKFDQELVIETDDEPVATKHETIQAKLLREFNDLPGNVISPLKIRAELAQIITNHDKVMAKINEICKNASKVHKTIVSDTLIHDPKYMRTLLRGYKFLVRPGFSRRLREELDSMFIGVTITTTFNQRFIAYNDTDVLFVCIMNT